MLQCEGDLSGIIADTMSMPRAALRAILDLNNQINSGSSRVFFIKPKKENNVIYRNQFTVFVPLGLVEQLATQLIQVEVAKKVEFFCTLCVSSKTSSAAGWIFEQIIHDFLIGTESITIHWFDKEQSFQTLKLSGLDMHTMDNLDSSPPFYWRTGSPNYPGIDGAIVTKDHVHVIQATISREHGTPQEGVDKLWKAMAQSKKVLQWKCLFVGPAETQTEQVSKPYAFCLKVGDRETRADTKREGLIPRTYLQVGQFTVCPGVSDSMSSMSCLPHCEG